MRARRLASAVQIRTAPMGVPGRQWRFLSVPSARPFTSATDSSLDEEFVEYVNDAHPISGLTLLPGFVTPEEQEEMVRELEGVFKGKRYSFAEHWDQVIIGYRECERSIFKFSPKNQQTIKRLTDAIGAHEAKLFPHVHVLDIHEDGEMKPHVDSVKFSGGIVAGLSLLSPCVFELHHEKSPARVHLLLEPGTFYIMSGDSRYEWAHGIRKGKVAFKGRDVTRTRRLSLMLRDFKEDDVFKNHHHGVISEQDDDAAAESPSSHNTPPPRPPSRY